MSKIKLTDVCNIVTGKLDSNAAEENGKYPYFTCAPQPLYINEYAFDDNVILLAGNNASGNFHCQRFKGKFNAYQRTYVITAKEGYDIDYIYYNLKINLKHFKKLAQGSQTKFLTMKILESFEIEDLDIDEQTRLVNILLNLDAKIETNNKINVELESMAKTIYDYWFLKFEFPNEEGKPYKSSGGKMIWNEELKREIPEGWEYGCFKDIISELECGNRPKGGIKDNINDGIPSIGAENIISIGKYDFSSEKYISEEYFNSLKKGIVKSNDVLIYKDGAGVGNVSMAKNNFPHEKCAVNSHVFIVRSKDNNLYQNYIYLTLEKDYIKKILVSLAMKAAQPGLNQPNIESIPIIIPTKNTIIKFNKIINFIFDKIFLNANENKELSSLRDFLLPLLMNGQVGFKEEALTDAE